MKNSLMTDNGDNFVIENGNNAVALLEIIVFIIV